MGNYSQHFQKMNKQKRKKMSIGYHSNKIKKNSPLAQTLGFLSILGFCLALYGILYPENVAQIFNAKISFLAQGEASNVEENAETKGAEQEKIATPTESEKKAESVKQDQKVSENVSHIDQLLSKEKELVEREKKIVEMEEKLQQTKLELDKKIEQLDQARRDIASKLETRVVQDQESLDKLVGVYSNMKPQSAALVISKLDEELAISVLKKMKKQDAGSILNYMDAQKAKTLSEKYSGY